MSNIIEITHLDAPELAAYVRLTEAQLRNRLHPEAGLFIAESPKVIGYALDAGYAPVFFWTRIKRGCNVLAARVLLCWRRLTARHSLTTD